MGWGFSKNKYKAQRSNGFASKLESSLHDILKLRIAAGELTNLRTQVNVRLTKAKILYIADFCAFHVERKVDVYFESKGYETDSWRLKRRLWMHYGPGELEIWCGTYARPYLRETIVPTCE